MNLFKMSFVALASVALVMIVAGCGPIARDKACVAAEKCDNAREEPFTSFDAEDAQFGDLGTCWQNPDTAKACIAACDSFVADELAIGRAANNIGVIAACGG